MISLQRGEEKGRLEPQRSWLALARIVAHVTTGVPPGPAHVAPNAADDREGAEMSKSESTCHVSSIAEEMHEMFNQLCTAVEGQTLWCHTLQAAKWWT